MKNKTDTTSTNWADDLVRFLCEQPGVGAVRLDPAAHRVSVATLGQVDLANLEQKLAATIAAVEERFADQPAQLRLQLLPAAGRLGRGRLDLGCGSGFQHLDR